MQSQSSARLVVLLVDLGVEDVAVNKRRPEQLRREARDDLVGVSKELHVDVGVVADVAEAQHRRHNDGEVALVAVAEAHVNLGATEVRDRDGRLCPTLGDAERVLHAGRIGQAA